MKKSLLDKPAADEIIARIERLEPHTPRRWGTMTATEMLYHCNASNERILNDKEPYRRQSVKQKLITFAAINILPAFPRNNKGPAITDAKGKVATEEFAEQKEKYVKYIKNMNQSEKPFTSLHPAMGFLKMHQWGIVAWMHMDHHLRQFGL